jgi:hypothetical protein
MKNLSEEWLEIINKKNIWNESTKSIWDIKK